MRAEINGLQGLIREVNRMAVYIWCWAHPVVIKTVGFSLDAVETLFAFISRSKLRIEVYSKMQTEHYEIEKGYYH